MTSFLIPAKLWNVIIMCRRDNRYKRIKNKCVNCSTKLKSATQGTMNRGTSAGTIKMLV
jgi:hypothetical protein